MRFLLITLFIISSLFSCALSAQEEGYDETPTDDKLDRIAAKLQLTEDQRSQVAIILDELALEARPTTPEEKKTRRRALRTQVIALLTAEQKALIRQGRSARNSRKASATSGKAKRTWFDAQLDDVATPLLNQRNHENPDPN